MKLLIAFTAVVPNLMRVRNLLFIFLTTFIFLPSAVNAAPEHPLRPFPKEAPKDDISQEFLTPYCASRPTAIQLNKFDKREEKIILTVQGDLTSDFTEFVTPLLSITDENKADYSINYGLKAQRYMADYLEGRAYYEPFEEPNIPTTSENRDILARSGVFRKLAPQTYQDKLKRILIQRSHQDYSSLDELEAVYGFRPASIYVNPDTPVQNLILNDFYLNWAPIPEDFDTWEEYKLAKDAWEIKDGGKWFNLWPYVPMFSREDSEGSIITFDEPKQISNPKSTTVFHPHLARTYEVASTLSNMLSPWERHQTPQDPSLPSQWITPAPWTTDLFWIESDLNAPSNYGPVCDPQNTFVSSSGDLALDSSLLTQVDSLLLDEEYIVFDNPQYPPPRTTDNCGEHWACESCNEQYDQNGQLVGYSLDTNDPNCFYYQNVRYSPTYLETKTPYLAQIMDRLSTGPTALFNIFRTTKEIASDPPQNWPGLGISNKAEENPEYFFSSGPAEAGLKNPGNKAKYYYKYLGYLQCQKEKILTRLLPAGLYTSFSPECNLFPKDDDDNDDDDDSDSNINCNQNAQAETPPGTLNKEAFAMVADRWRPGGHPHVEECYNDVVSRAIAAGINPTFALLIWLNESGASNYDGFDEPIEDFGIHTATDTGPEDFSGQIDHFLNLPSTYASICGQADMETFTARFLTGHCEPTPASLDYLNGPKGLKVKWDWIAPGIPFPNYP